MTQDDKLVLKYTQAGFSEERIAAKLGITPAQVRARLEAIQSNENAAQVNGYDALVNEFNELAAHYQSQGEKLKMLGDAFSQTATLEQIKALVIPDSPEQTAKNIKQAFIVLRRFDPTAAQNRVDSMTSKN